MNDTNEPIPAPEPTATRSKVETDSAPASIRPLGIIGPEWSLRRSARGAALWRHAGVLAMSSSARKEPFDPPGSGVEVLALDRASLGRRFQVRDDWNAPAPGVRFRVRRVNAGPRTAPFDDLDRARLEGSVIDWVRTRRPRLVHVLDLDPFGAGVLLALEAAGVASVLSIERADALVARAADPAAALEQRVALASARRIVVRTREDAVALESVGAPRSRVRVIQAARPDEASVLRAFASLYRLIAPCEAAASGTEIDPAAA